MPSDPAGHTPVVALVWAQAHDGIIGSAGSIPWHLPEDLAHFKAVTDAATVVMGRRTWDSLPERFRPLPGRRNIVVTRDADWAAAGAERAGSVDDALAADDSATDPATTIWVIGGGEVYREALARASRLEVTELDLAVPGDTRAPAVDGEWTRAHASEWMVSRTGIRFRFVGYERPVPRN
ncbi:dihydrofolate reductase [Cryobacterium glucosi]|uniref:dihydrofolate reductase n=1 Tax=Cryobacterium glucosi TaxID=1259175 RepID=UPI002407A5FE|nr:dihydrofolate reductase [Cryobacterium glucosi]